MDLLYEEKQQYKRERDYIPWIEKYRPRNIQNLILSDIIQEKINNIILSKKMPNIIITGSPGTGKTSTILCLAKSILGPNYKKFILELNASDNRGLDYISSSVTYFCKRKICNENDQTLKLIIFDEADNITKKAQNALSNLIEKYSHNTRFAFTCNESSKIIESIHSRCIILKFNTLDKDNIIKRLLYICNKENIEYDELGLYSIYMISNGDIRQSINNLEAIYYGYGFINEENVYKLCYQPHPKIITEMIMSCVNMNLLKAIKIINVLKSDGYCLNDIVLCMINILKEMNIDENIRINFIKYLSDLYITISNGIDSNLQFYSCLSKMILFINEI